MVEPSSMNKLVRVVSGAGASSPKLLKKPPREGSSGSSSSATEAEEESNNSSFDTSATATITPGDPPPFSLAAAPLPRNASERGTSSSLTLEPKLLGGSSGSGGGREGGMEGGVEEAPSLERERLKGGETDPSSSIIFQPPDEGTPAAEALAANAAIPRIARGSVLMRANSTRMVGNGRSGSSGGGSGGGGGGRLKKLNRTLTAQQAAAAAAAKRKKKRRNFQGNVIKGEHEQYTLTIGMMLGIRVAVGRPQQMDDLTLMDFMQVDKYLFPPKGCNKPPHRTPPHHLSHDFKFKDYAPKIFHRIRQLFGIDSASYMLSVSGNYNYLEFMSNSKSGQFFFYSHDGRFMIKTQTSEENKFLRKILPHYYQYVSLNPNTLLTRFYGMHRVKMRHLKRKVHFVIMHSVFDTKEKIYRIYDLKGSTVGRSSGPDKVRKEGVVYKDLDLVDDQVKFQLGTKRRLFMEQLEKDATFLASLNIMDYSLLIGIHDKTRRDDSFERGGSISGSVTGSGGGGGGGGAAAAAAAAAAAGGGGGGVVLDDLGAPLGVSSHPYVEGAEPLHHHPAAQLPPSLPPPPPHPPHLPSGVPSQTFLPRSRREYSYESEGAQSHSLGGGGMGHMRGRGGMRRIIRVTMSRISIRMRV